MDKSIWGIIHHRKAVMLVFGILVLLSILLATQVQVNYDLQDYLPQEVNSVLALDKLSSEFSTKLPNARVALPIRNLQDGLVAKAALSNTKGVQEVLWLDDSLDTASPLEMTDPTLVEAFYRDGIALYQVTADQSQPVEVLNRLYQLDEQVMVDGNLVDLANAQQAVGQEISKLMAVVMPIVLVILLLSTHAWLEPVPFLLAIGVGVVLNMGTNIFLGSVSYITQAVAAVLQLAVSMDYAIFLLNRFNENRKSGHDPETAMALAMRKSLSAIASSALTTLLGFLALLFMRFGLGADLGIVMAKGIVFSFLSVMIFMPAFILIFYKFLDKTAHRSFLPDFSFVGRFVSKGKVPILLLAALVAVPAFLGSRKNDFIYGTGNYPVGSRIERDRQAIVHLFDEQQQQSLLVPKGNVPAELALAEKLKEDPDIVSVISYVSTVDPAIPPAMLEADQLAMLESEHYRQFIITAKVAPEGQVSFAQAERVRAYAEEGYGQAYYYTGQNVITLDMRDTIQADDYVVNGLAILAIALTIMSAFRSLSLPIILVLTIELAIWINLSIPYFLGNPLSYIGYLIISTVQLGATVDYAILYTEHYLDNRKRFHKMQALLLTSREAIPSLLPPALILTAAGISLQYTSTLTIVSELGQVLGRGAILSFLMVILVLPCLLYFADPILPYTTWKLNLLKDQDPERAALAERDSVVPPENPEGENHEEENPEEEK